MIDEKEQAIKIANKILDTPYADPDSDESVLARQFLRSLERPCLFVPGDVILSSGQKSKYRIECSTLSCMDWDALALMAKECNLLPRFCKVVGVPRGGIPFANALEKYVDPTSKLTLVVDDVWTTGNSMLNFIDSGLTQSIFGTPPYWIGLVAFERGRIYNGRIRAIWNRGSGW